MTRNCHNCRHNKNGYACDDDIGFDCYPSEANECSKFEPKEQAEAPVLSASADNIAPTTLTATYRAPDRGTLTLTATDGITRLDAHDWDINAMPLQPVLDDFLKRLKP